MTAVTLESSFNISPGISSHIGLEYCLILYYSITIKTFLLLFLALPTVVFLIPTSLTLNTSFKNSLYPNAANAINKNITKKISAMTIQRIPATNIAIAKTQPVPRVAAHIIQ